MDNISRQLIEMLTFPRLKAIEALDLGVCPHGGVFHARDQGCQTCIAMFECSWLKSHEPFVDLASQSRPELVASLRLAIDFLVSQNHRKNSAIKSCVCESCRWIENANRLIREAEGRSEVAK
ncbi:MAG: hypothetical protein HKN59_02670 [Gammaproteobacteria bacterium]|nr:hypothetical protein [Gammaproteobacteria bacterium]